MRDVVIVGGGVAGAYLGSGLDAVVIEKSPYFLEKDSGIVSGRFLDFFPKKMIKNVIKKMVLISPKGNSYIISSQKPFSYIIKRRAFAEHLRNESELVFETAKKIIYGKEYCIVKTDKNTYKSRLVIGADGAASLCRREANIKGPELFQGIMSISKPFEGDIKVFFNKNYSPDFFSWIIPQNGECGLITKNNSMQFMEKFIGSEKLKKGNIFSHPIPIGTCRSYSNRLILVGDSCGQTKPLTGGGIVFSLIAADCAVRQVNACLASGDFSSNFISSYEKAWKSKIKKEIDKQFFIRKLYTLMSEDDVEFSLKQTAPYMKNFDYDFLSKSVPLSKKAALAIRNSKYLFKIFPKIKK